MLYILITWIGAIIIFFSFGEIISQAFYRYVNKETESWTLTDSFFSGLCVISGIASILSLFLPSNIYTFAALLFISTIYWLINRDRFLVRMKQLANLFLKLNIFYKILCVTVFAAIILYESAPLSNFDTGLYHLQSIMWNESYKVIPGIGNLHGRLAFNSNYLLLCPIFSLKPILGQDLYSLNSLAVFVLSAWIIQHISKTKSTLFQISLGLINVSFFLYYRIFLSCPVTDILPGVIIAYLILRIILDSESIKDSPLVFWLGCIYCLTLKLSAFPICIILLLSIIYLLKNRQIRIITILIGLSVFIFIPWCIRNIIISGYLIYPYPEIDLFGFDWKIPRDLVEMEKGYVLSWARIPGLYYKDVIEMPIWEWVRYWVHLWKRLSPLTLSTVVLAAITPLLFIICYKKKSTKRVFVPWAISYFGFLTWFYLAPDPRFGYAFIVLSLFLPICLFKSPNIKFENIIPIIFCVAFGFTIPVQINSLSKYDVKSLSLILKPIGLEHVDERQNNTFEYQVSNNIKIYYPKNNSQCFDHNLPCILEYNPKLEARGKTLEEGFRTKQQ